MGYRRNLLERLGGFDEDFGTVAGGAPVWGEDVDLAWRAKAARARVVFEPAAVVVHDVRGRSFAEQLKDLRRREGIVRAVAKNRELRQQCHYHWFWIRSHPPALMAALGILMAVGAPSARRRIMGAALTVPYLHYRPRTLPLSRRRHWPATLPLALLADLAEIGVFLRASARYRTLVL